MCCGCKRWYRCCSWCDNAGVRNGTGVNASGVKDVIVVGVIKHTHMVKHGTMVIVSMNAAAVKFGTVVGLTKRVLDIVPWLKCEHFGRQACWCFFPRLRGFLENVQPFIPGLPFFLSFFFNGSRTLIPFFRPGSVHSGSASRRL